MKKQTLFPVTAILFLVTFFLIAAFTVYGAPNAAKVVLVTGEWEPYTTEKAEGKGYFTEIVTAVFKEMGLEPQYVFYPWERCEKSVQKGEAWAAFPYAYTPERAKLYEYTDTVAYAYTKFFYYKKNFDGDKIKFNKLEDLKQYRIGGVTGFFYKEAFEKAGLNVDWSTKEEDTIHKLVKDRVDLMPYGELVGWEIIKKNYPNEIKNFGVLSKPINEGNGDLKLIVSKTYPNFRQLLEKFNNALKAIRGNGVYQQILKKYNIQE
ncbi:MAG: substrate-binding periplasmic protein [Bacillota bacterium]